MRDQMQVGDLAFFYHSSCPEPGIAGIVDVSKAAYPDATQFDRKSQYFDAKATRDAPRWFNVEVTLVEKTRLVSLAELRDTPGACAHARAAARQPAVDHAGRPRASGRSSRPSWRVRADLTQRAPARRRRP